MGVILVKSLTFCQPLAAWQRKFYSVSIERAGYTVRQAARRMGMTEASIRQRIAGARLTVIDGTSPIQVQRNEVDSARAESLAKYSDVIDASDLATAGAPVLGPELVAEWVRAVAAAQELLDHGVESVRRSNRVLTDSLISILPVSR